MVDTQRITSTSLIAVCIGEVAAALATEHPRRMVHLFAVASYFPLDVESVARVMDCLQGQYHLDQLRLGGLSHWVFLEPQELDAPALRRYQRGDHLAPDGQLMRQLAALARDDEEYRRTRDQHDLLRLVSELDDLDVEFSRLAHGTAMTSARLKSLLNDFVAAGHVQVEVDEERDTLHYTFPPLDYPASRHEHIMVRLQQVEQRRGGKRRAWLLAVAILGVLALLVMVVGQSIGAW